MSYQQQHGGGCIACTCRVTRPRHFLLQAGVWGRGRGGKSFQKSTCPHLCSFFFPFPDTGNVHSSSKGSRPKCFLSFGPKAIATYKGKLDEFSNCSWGAPLNSFESLLFILFLVSCSLHAYLSLSLPVSVCLFLHSSTPRYKIRSLVGNKYVLINYRKQQGAGRGNTTQ